MPTMARGAVLRAFNEPLTLEEAPVPDPGAGAIVARIDLGGICGTDVHLHHGNLPIPTPVILGHEAVGRVEKLGAGVTADFNGEPLREGDAIAWASSIPCGRCYWCVVEKERTLCENRKIYGINQRFDQGPRLSGGWADYIYLQPGSAVFKLPVGISPLPAIALGCAGPTAVHGIMELGGIGVGETVVVRGAARSGWRRRCTPSSPAPRRRSSSAGRPAGLQLAREIGVGDVHVDIFTIPDAEERKRLVLVETPAGRGADVVLECAGVPSAVPEGFDLARRNARFLVLGQYTDRGTVPINPHVITRKQLKVYGSWAFAEAHYGRYLATLPQLAARFDLGRLVTGYPLTEANQALADMASGAVMKAVLAPGD